MKKYKTVLSIAGSDSGGGAGIQADLKTFSSLGCYGSTVVTALTAQNTTGVQSVYEVPVAFVEKQIDAVLTDIGADAVKIGMLWSDELIESVAGIIKKYGLKNIVVDPVMSSQSGHSLVKDNIAAALMKHLLPLATVFTPNLPEAEKLLGYPVCKLRDMETAAQGFVDAGCDNVLIKGGHLDGGECVDVYLSSRSKELILFRGRRIDTVNNHGTGCTLSSAIAACLAKGDTPEKAVAKSKKYITNALNAGADYSVGKGSGPVLHFFENASRF